jgi:nitrite reductase/ring-hydroxylating ferredoxin subunit/uncharacterized membrane protein
MSVIHRLVDRLERERSLDPIADKLAAIGRPLQQRPALNDALTGRWLGHSVHPALVLVPMGCWFGSAVLDASTPGSAAARRLTGVGVLAAAPAALTGAAEWLDTGGAERRVGTAHAIANDVAVTAFALSWLARRRGANGVGLGLSIVGMGAIAVSGYLGGHLAYVRGVAVNTTAFQSGPTDWQAVGRLDGMPDGVATRLDVEGPELVAVRDGDEVHVLEDRCTHRGGPLSEGEVIDGCVECPWHGSRFDLADGRVRRGPAAVAQPVYETRVVDGHVEVRRTELGDLRAHVVGAS